MKQEKTKATRSLPKMKLTSLELGQQRQRLKRKVVVADEIEASTQRHDISAGEGKSVVKIYWAGDDLLSI